MRTSILTQNPTHIEDFNLVYRRTITSNWQFVGYRCIRCDRVLKNDSTVPKHKKNCNAYERKHFEDPAPEQIINNKGEIWKPFDISTHKNTKHSLKDTNKNTA